MSLNTMDERVQLGFAVPVMEQVRHVLTVAETWPAV